MQLTALGKEDRMGFFQMLSRPSGDRAFLSGAFLFLSLLILPFSGDRPFALLYLVAGLSFLWVAFGRFQSLIGLLLPLFLLYGVGGGVTLPTAYLSLLLGGACGVELLFYFRRPLHRVLLLLLPAAAFGAAVLLRGDLGAGLLTLLPIPLVLSGYLLISRCTGLTRATVITAGVLAVTLFAAGVLTLLLSGELNGNPLTIFAGKAKAYFLSYVEKMQAAAATAGTNLSLNEEEIARAADEIGNLLLGLFLALCVTVSHLYLRLVLRLTLAFGVLPRLPRRLAALTVSLVSAVFFLLACIFGAVAGESFAGAVADNLRIALTPVFATVGALTLIRPRSPSCLSMLFPLLLLFLLFQAPAAGIYILSAFGAVVVLFGRFFPPTRAH